jgi:hypothetical protein
VFFNRTPECAGTEAHVNLNDLRGAEAPLFHKTGLGAEFSRNLLVYFLVQNSDFLND